MILKFILLIILSSAFASSPSSIPVEFLNGSESQKDQVLEAVKIISSKLHTDEFKQRVKNYSQPTGEKKFHHTTLSNDQVLNLILIKEWSYKIAFYSNCFTSTVAYVESPNPRIHINWCKSFNTPRLANTLTHEHLHNFGFTHEVRWNEKRDHSVPYAVGQIMEDLIYESENYERPKVFVPWYKRIWKWIF